MKREITIKNNWPFDFQQGQESYRVEEITLGAPTILARQEYYRAKGSLRAKTIAQCKKMIRGLPSGIFDAKGFTYALYLSCVKALNEEFVDQDSTKRIAEEVFNSDRLELPQKMKHTLHLPLNVDDAVVETVWIHPPPLASYDLQTEDEFPFWAPPFFAEFLRVSIGGETKPLPGDAILFMSYQDAEEILLKLDLFTPPALAEYGASAALKHSAGS